jgi:hypothetical protein
LDAGVLNTIALRLVVVMFFVIAIMGYFIYQKSKNQKKVIGKVWGEFITKEGNSYHRLIPIQPGGRIEIKPRKDEKGKIFGLDAIGTYLADYPPGKWAFVQTKVKKAIFDEESMEPLSNRSGILTISPIRLFNLVNERFSSLGVAFSQDEAEKAALAGGKKKSGGGGNMMYIILALLGVGMGGLIYYVVTNLDKVKAAVGMP